MADLTDKKGNKVSVLNQGKGNIHQFVIVFDESNEVGGFAAYMDNDANERIFFHTETAEKYQGYGLASILASEALAATAKEGKKVVAACPYIRTYIQKHKWDGDHRPAGPADIMYVQEHL
ncbi:MAG: GNAT family N-acetyltransferase [Actinomycetaceae bacterium]|nr:N-acetyltransferase [Arcanobacterium sp.]MDD7504792.1 GNAT family N-acetyltransferase [Actinomycetaceae bacterium]MDY6142679.1 GNAT family N-acetyltransferase [Arcanobacterium sp.]